MEHTLGPKMQTPHYLMFDTIILWSELCLEYICPNKQLNIKLVQYCQPKFV